MNIKSTHTRSRFLPITISVLVVLFILISIFHNFFSGIIYTISEPLLTGRGYIGQKISSIQDFFRSQDAVLTENNQLKDELTLAKIRLSEFEALQIENESLRALTGFRGEVSTSSKSSGSSKGAKGTIARVLASPSFSPYDTLVIDQGSDQGIKQDGEVRVWGDKLIGFVSQVFPSSAIVTLLSSPGYKIDVRVATNTPSIAFGRGAGNFLITVPKDAPGTIGDRVTAPLYRETLGSVSFVESNESESMKRLYVSFPFSVFSIEWVMVYPPNPAYAVAQMTATSTPASTTPEKKK